VDRVLGEGGMGVVVAATHLALDERVALKFMLPGMIVDAAATRRFIREAKAALKLKSEHVAKVRDVGALETGAPYIVMEFLEGHDLGKELELRGPLPLARMADFVIQACDAIAEALARHRAPRSQAREPVPQHASRRRAHIGRRSSDDEASSTNFA